VQCILTGVLAETLSRIYLGSGDGSSYVRRHRKEDSGALQWHQPEGDKVQ